MPGTILELLHHVGVFIPEAFLVGGLFLLHDLDAVPGAALGLFLDTYDFFLHAVALFPEVVLVLHFELSQPLLELDLVARRLGRQLSLQIVGACQDGRG